MNLKNILITNTPAEILDLINYNFDQLLANGYGPQGTTGDAGADGTVGVQGVQGVQGGGGAAGADGVDGAVTGVEWVNDTTTVTGANIMIPKNIADVTSLTAVSIGEDDIITSNEASQLVVGRNTTDFASNIRLTVPGSVNYVDFIQDISTLNISFNSSATNTLFKISGATIKFSDVDDDEFASFSETEISFKKNVSFDATVEFNDTLKLGINGSATTGDVLVAQNNDGLLEWKAPSTLGANVPIGTVVPILSSLYNATNFTKTSTYTDDGTSLNDFTTIAGTGVADTEYEGWYLCHGYSWFNFAAGIAYNTPEVSGKKFTDDNATILQDTDDTILSGARLSVVANTSGGTNIETSINTTPISKKLGDAVEIGGIYCVEYGHTEFNVIKLPHIIYLGTANTLSWRYIDFSHANVYNEDLKYYDAPALLGAAGACTYFNNNTITAQEYGTAGWSSFVMDENSVGRMLWVSDGVLASPGWYITTGSTANEKIGYWEGARWTTTLATTCDMSN